MVRVIRLKPVEDVPHAVEFNSHPFVLAVLLLLSVPFLLLLGYLAAMPMSSLVAGWVGAFATAGLVRLRPINLFGYWKDCRRFTPGERKAVTYLRSRTVRLVILRIALLTGSLPALGALWGRIVEGRILLPESAFLFIPLESWIVPWLQVHGFAILFSGFFFVALYYPIVSRDLRRRWTWIQQTQVPAGRESVERQYQALTQRYLVPLYRRYLGLNHE